MTGLLEDLLASKAAAIDPPALDLDRVVADGNRRIRRRRGLVVAATAAVVAGAVAIAWGVVAIDRSADPVSTPFREPRPTYSAGSTIHYGDTTVEVGHQISALVRTGSGFVFTTSAADVFLADGKHVRRIGTTGGRLVADDTGPYVGWTDSDSYVVYDTAARRELEHNGAGSGPATVVAIDDGNVYLTKADGLHRWNPADKTDDLVARDTKAEDVFDVAAGRYAIRSRLPVPAGPTFVVSADPTADQPGARGETADLAPGGGAVVARSAGGPAPSVTVGQWLSVYTTGSFKQVTISHPRYAGLGSIAWLDDDRFTTWGSTNSRVTNDVATIVGSADDVDLLTCSIRAGACTVTQQSFAKLKADDSDPAFRLPNGQLWSGVRG